MKNHLIAFLLLAMSLSTASQAQNRGDVISTSVIFDFSKSQTQNSINGIIPINLPNWVVNLLTDIDYGTKGYKVNYWTVDFDNNMVPASGLVVVPKSYSCNHDMFVYCHGTVFEKDQVPSNFSGAGDGVEIIFGLIYGGNGYLTVMPDYLGLGDSPEFHLYVDEKTETTATVDLMKAAQNLSNTNGWGLTGDVLLSGYSQGGHAGMSVFKSISQTNQPNGLNDIATVGLGSGPYDLSNTQYNFILDDPFYPTREYILYTIASCQEAYGNIYTEPEDILKDPYAELYTTEILGQTGNTAWVPSPYADMFQPGVYSNYVNNPNNPLKQCLAQSDVADWYNTTNSAFYYCTGDEQVDYHNSLVAEDEMEDNLPWYYFWYA
ncbi:MAG: lipase family protein, partial [Bacteroidota bacterium]